MSDPELWMKRIDRDEQVTLLVESMKEFAHQGGQAPHPLLDAAIAAAEEISTIDALFIERGWS